MISLRPLLPFDMPDPVVQQGGGRASRVRYRLTAALVKRGEGRRWQVFSGLAPRAG